MVTGTENTRRVKKVVIVANSYYPGGTANSINVFRMLTAFYKRGYDITLIARRSYLSSIKRIWKNVQENHGDCVSANIYLLWWPFRKYSELIFSIYSLLYLFFLSRENIVYTRVRYVAVLATFFKFNTTYESHCPPIRNFSKKLEKWLISSKNFKIVLISEGLLEAYKGVGIRLNNYIISPDAARLLMESFPCKTEFIGGCNNIGYVGSLYQGRGIELIFQIANVMRNRKFHIIGDKSNFKFTKEIPKNVFFYGKMSPHQAELITSLFDILLMPYQEKVMVRNGLETSKWMSPMKLFEYMLSGKPIISSDMPAIKEILTNKVNAYLVKPSKVSEWCAAIEELDDSTFRYEISKNAFNEAREKYTWERRVDKILNHCSY